MIDLEVVEKVGGSEKASLIQVFLYQLKNDHKYVIYIYSRARKEMPSIIHPFKESVSLHSSLGGKTLYSWLKESHCVLKWHEKV